MPGELVELNWETDFVARNVDVTHTAAFLAKPESSTTSCIHHVPRMQLLDAPLSSATEGPTPRLVRRTAGLPSLTENPRDETVDCMY